MLQEIATKIGFDWKLAITHLVNFLILFFLIVKFFGPTVKKIIEERTKKIEDGVKKSEKAKKILLNAEAEYKNIIQEAKTKQNQILIEAENKSKEILDYHQEQANLITEQANKKLQYAEKVGFENGLKSFEELTPSFLKALAIKSFDDKLTPEINNNFIQKIIKSS